MKNEIIHDIAIALADIALDEDLSVLLKEAIDGYVLGDLDDFEYILGKVEACSSTAVTMKELRDAVSSHDIHRSELWRGALLSATNSKHNSPIEYADKVLSHYDEKFGIK